MTAPYAPQNTRPLGRPGRNGDQAYPTKRHYPQAPQPTDELTSLQRNVVIISWMISLHGSAVGCRPTGSTQPQRSPSTARRYSSSATSVHPISRSTRSTDPPPKPAGSGVSGG